MKMFFVINIPSIGKNIYDGWEFFAKFLSSTLFDKQVRLKWNQKI